MKTVSAKLSYFMSVMQTILFILKDSLHHAWKHFLRAQQCKCAKCLLVAFVSFRIQHGEQTALLESIGSHGGLNAKNLPGGDSEEEEWENKRGETRKIKEPIQTGCANMSTRVFPRLSTTKNFLLREKEGIIYL